MQFDMMRAFQLLVGALLLAHAQAGPLKHIRIVDKVETVVTHHVIGQLDSNSSASVEVSSPVKRWDGSPAAPEWQPALNRGCTLDGMLNLDDAGAGRLLVPPRPLAHSDFLDANGRY